MVNYKVKSPILLLIFNRPIYTGKVFEQISRAKPRKLYIAADGPRAKVEGEIEKCQKARSIIDKINWECTVSTLFRTENLGCKIGVSTAIDWFFENEEEGIILEDDCLPNQSFFRFCDVMLEHYRYDQRVGSITGSNHHNKESWGTASYYFSQRSDIWGWASWRRTWEKYDVSLSNYSVQEAATLLKKMFADELLLSEWLTIFEQVKRGAIDTWDYQFHFLNFVEYALCVVPNHNLISNIGFGEDATHTFDVGSTFANAVTTDLETITHPTSFIPEKEADRQVFEKEFKLSEKRMNIKKDELLRRRVKRWFKKLFKK
ncbi:nucleotide-diphospho-sugar transferase [Parapedobacter tibetensis]|uniref:nucleotide-diphospho-sugar transferase n=1 Tax=Parapedobacter tibetensis TaxID=2972951 RepID=UPI00214DB383|nr:nucleotide-diphospho-sugar transferase [Parapedobacter tibetensis]